MRILLLSHYFAPENGAPQRRWDALIREFIAAGHEVEVMAPPQHYPAGKRPPEFAHTLRVGSSAVADCGARVNRVAWLRHRGDIVTRTLDHMVASLASYRRASRRIRKREFVPDVIIATAPAVPTLIAGRLLSRRFGIPLVVEMRDAWPDLVTHTPMLGKRHGPAGWVKQRIHESITALQRSGATVVTTTESFAGVLHERGVRQVHVIRNGTHPEIFEQVPEHELHDGALRVLYMGTIGRSQGLELVVQAVAELKRMGTPIEARIIGQGHERRPLMRLNAQLGYPVEFLPAVAPSEVAAHYAWADTTIVSLRDWEPFDWTIPSKLYELLSSGRHVTAIVRGESAQIIRDAEAGDVVTPGHLDELVRTWRALSLDPGRLQRDETGRQWAREHVAFASLAEHYLGILQQVTGESPDEVGLGSR